MATSAVERHGISIRLACEALGHSETCYRYQVKLSDENAEIADWLVRLTHNLRNWGLPDMRNGSTKTQIEPGKWDN